MNDEKEYWHLSKAVPVSIILFLIVQTFGLVIWATKLDSRVAVLEVQDIQQVSRIQRMEDIHARVAIIEERQMTMIQRLDIQTKTMQEILSLVAKIRTSNSP